MKFLGKISALILIVLIIGMNAMAQNAPQSRLNVGKEVPKLVANPKSSNLYFSAVPNKLTFNSKAEYTRFYRNLLLNSGTNKVVASVDNKSTVKISEAVVQIGEKVKFGNIYPNPANAFTNVDFEVKSSFTEARVTVLNMVGSTLLEYPLSTTGSSLRLNTSSLESGIYMVQFVVDNKKVATQKLLIERK